jgi:hypothetical protein
MLASHKLAMLLGVAAVTLGASAHADDIVITEQARNHFAAGVALLQDPSSPRYEEAYREFKTAYAASPSYKILGNLALCAMKIERDAEAIHAYETYLKEAGPEVTSQQREQMQRDLLTLKAGVLEVTVSSVPPGATIVDVRTPVQGADIHNSYGQVLTPLALGLRHGHHVITARMPGYVDQPWEFEATDTAALAPHVFTMAKPAPAERMTVAERPVPAGAYVVGGTTAALVLTGSFFGALALKKHNDFTSLNDGEHVAEAESARSSGQTLNIVTDAFFAGAIVSAGITAYLVLARGTAERPVAYSNPRAPRFWPDVDFGGVGAIARAPGGTPVAGARPTGMIARFSF